MPIGMGLGGEEAWTDVIGNPKNPPKIKANAKTAATLRKASLVYGTCTVLFGLWLRRRDQPKKGERTSDLSQSLNFFSIPTTMPTTATTTISGTTCRITLVVEVTAWVLVNPGGSISAWT